MLSNSTLLVLVVVRLHGEQQLTDEARKRPWKNFFHFSQCNTDNMVNAWMGAALGLAAQLLTNGSRLLPLSRRPWEHLAAMALGAYIGKIWGEYQHDKIERKEYRMKRDLERARRENQMRLEQVAAENGA